MSAHYAMCKYDDATGSYIPLPDGIATGFEEWFQIYAPTAPESLDDCALAAFHAGAASRDAEVAELTTQRTAFKDAAAYNKRRAEDAERQRDDMLAALNVARARVSLDRETLFECHKDFSTNTVNDDLGKNGLAEYDEVLLIVDAAIARATDQFRDAAKMIGAPATANYPHGSLGEAVESEGGEA